MQVPATQYDDKFLQFLKDFTLKALATYKDTISDKMGIDEDHPVSFEERIR
jgi:hypothetical protein